MQGKFTAKAKEAIENAQKSAGKLGHEYVGTEHLLLGLSLVEDCVAQKVLHAQSITSKKIEEKIEEIIGSENGKQVNLRDFTPRTKRVLEASLQEALRMGTGYIGTEHLLLALVRDIESIAVRILIILQVNPQRLYDDILYMLGESEKTLMGLPIGKKNSKQNRKSDTPTLDQYSRDLTILAKEEKFDPVIGRDNEIQRVIQILSRRTKNNPCLIGDPGVGKTAIAEGLAQKIVEGNIPETLANKRVVSLDLSSMVAGSKYRGEFEDRIKKVMNEVKNSFGHIILFIDEMHTIVGAGSAEGSLDASNILKPALSRGEMQVIGATTIDEYRKHIEKDSALERRFQPVQVDEPSEEETILILQGLKDKYEAHHNVQITDMAIIAAVKLSTQYITDRFLPDKAIDILDEASSKVRLTTFTPPDSVKLLEEKLKELELEKEAAIKTEEYEKASKIKLEQSNIKEELENKTDKWRNKNNDITHVVDEEKIADVVAIWTGIPVKKLQEAESKKLVNLENILHETVIGQEEAVKSLSKAIRRGRVGLKNPKRPTGSFLFLGPTGVGKTELSKALAVTLFGTEDAIVRVDMSEYMEKHTVSKMIGSPPGYVGYEEGGQLSEKIRRKPYSVVLFDEIEKAHPDVFNVLLQVLDDGHITDAQGRKISFKNTVIIMTSNAGARSIISPKKLGFSANVDEKQSYDDMKKGVMDEVKNIFRPEFINRIDDIIVFHQLDEENVKEIAKLMIKEMTDRVKVNMNIKINVDDKALSYIAKEGFDPSYGARPLRRVIQTKLEDELAEGILSGGFESDDTIKVTVKKEMLSIDKVKKRKPAEK